MKKATLSLTTIAALTVTTVALADEPNRTAGPTSTLPNSSVAPMASQPMAPQMGATQQATPPAPCPQTPVATTTITQAEIIPMTPPPPRDSVVIKQTFHPNRPLLFTGTSMFVSTYGATAAMTAVRDIRDKNGDQSMYIPIAGPWLHLQHSSNSALDTGLIVGSGVLQGTGAVLSVLSLFVPEHVPAATIQAGGVKMQFTATSYGKGTAGFGAVGQF